VTGTIQGNGVAVYSSAPTISRGNRFENNSASGIYLSSSSPVIDSCWISSSGDCGIKAAYYAHPVVTRTSLVANKLGLGAYISSKPVLGDTLTGQGGLNDIRDNTSYAVYNRTPYQVKAQRNWWGTDQPGPALFYGQTDYSGWLVIPPAAVGDGPGDLELVQGLGPNPFSGSVRLRLAVSPGDLPLAVSVYDARGRMVRKVTCRETAGALEVEWDGLDAFGAPTASGTYFISVASRRGVETRKVTLLR
jgi:parallel beta-helix repeat protein